MEWSFLSLEKLLWDAHDMFVDQFLTNFIGEPFRQRGLIVRPWQPSAVCAGRVSTCGFGLKRDIGSMLVHPGRSRHGGCVRMMLIITGGLVTLGSPSLII